MGVLRRRKPDIRVPTGRDTVNFRKLLFLPIKETEDLLSNKDWERVRAAQLVCARGCGCVLCAEAVRLS